MGFLQRFLQYEKVCIQCHNSPDADALASAYGVYCYLTAHGVEADIVYGGLSEIKRFGLQYMMENCGIHARYCTSLEEQDMLLIVDAQRGEGNVDLFPAKHIAMIDHHIAVSDQMTEDVLIRQEYQSCSTMIYELLLEEGYPVKENESLKIALLYGLFTDTSSFLDLYRERDMRMKKELFANYPVLERLMKSSMTVDEMMIVSDALQHHYFDAKKKFAIIQVLRCEQAILGIVGDFAIQVDAIAVSLAYTELESGYQISIRSCDDAILANELAVFLCKGIGSGGGHEKKAGGRIWKQNLQETYGNRNIFEILQEKMQAFIN